MRVGTKHGIGKTERSDRALIRPIIARRQPVHHGTECWFNGFAVGHDKAAASTTKQIDRLREQPSVALRACTNGGR
jgi:hypothetical protein